MSVMLKNDNIAQQKIERDATVAHAKTRARQRVKKLNEQTIAPNDEIVQICNSLLRLAQTYVPRGPSTLGDFLEVVQCAKTLQKIGLNPSVAANYTAVVRSTGDEIITNSLLYRQLRNKSIAGFATIADLTEKPAAVGSAEFQHGVREGYRRASDIAMMFLEDVQGTDSKC